MAPDDFERRDNGEEVSETSEVRKIEEISDADWQDLQMHIKSILESDKERLKEAFKVLGEKGEGEALFVNSMIDGLLYKLTENLKYSTWVRRFLSEEDTKQSVDEILKTEVGKRIKSAILSGIYQIVREKEVEETYLDEREKIEISFHNHLRLFQFLLTIGARSKEPKEIDPKMTEIYQKLLHKKVKSQKSLEKALIYFFEDKDKVLSTIIQFSLGGRDEFVALCKDILRTSLKEECDRTLELVEDWKDEHADTRVASEDELQEVRRMVRIKDRPKRITQKGLPVVRLKQKTKIGLPVVQPSEEETTQVDAEQQAAEPQVAEPAGGPDVSAFGFVPTNPNIVLTEKMQEEERAVQAAKENAERLERAVQAGIKKAEESTAEPEESATVPEATDFSDGEATQVDIEPQVLASSATEFKNGEDTKVDGKVPVDIEGYKVTPEEAKKILEDEKVTRAMQKPSATSGEIETADEVGGPPSETESSQLPVLPDGVQVQETPDGRILIKGSGVMTFKDVNIDLAPKEEEPKDQEVLEPQPPTAAPPVAAAPPPEAPPSPKSVPSPAAPELPPGAVEISPGVFEIAPGVIEMASEVAEFYEEPTPLPEPKPHVHIMSFKEKIIYGVQRRIRKAKQAKLAVINFISSRKRAIIDFISRHKRKIIYGILIAVVGFVSIYGVKRYGCDSKSKKPTAGKKLAHKKGADAGVRTFHDIKKGLDAGVAVKMDAASKDVKADAGPKPPPVPDAATQVQDAAAQAQDAEPPTKPPTQTADAGVSKQPVVVASKTPDAGVSKQPTQVASKDPTKAPTKAPSIKVKSAKQDADLLNIDTGSLDDLPEGKYRGMFSGEPVPVEDMPGGIISRYMEENLTKGASRAEKRAYKKYLKKLEKGWLMYMKDLETKVQDKINRGQHNQISEKDMAEYEWFINVYAKSHKKRYRQAGWLYSKYQKLKDKNSGRAKWYKKVFKMGKEFMQGLHELNPHIKSVNDVKAGQKVWLSKKIGKGLKVLKTLIDWAKSMGKKTPKIDESTTGEIQIDSSEFMYAAQETIPEPSIQIDSDYTQDLQSQGDTVSQSLSGSLNVDSGLSPTSGEIFIPSNKKVRKEMPSLEPSIIVDFNDSKTLQRSISGEIGKKALSVSGLIHAKSKSDKGIPPPYPSKTEIDKEYLADVRRRGDRIEQFRVASGEINNETAESLVKGVVKDIRSRTNELTEGFELASNTCINEDSEDIDYSLYEECHPQDDSEIDEITVTHLDKKENAKEELFTEFRTASHAQVNEDPEDLEYCVYEECHPQDDPEIDEITVTQLDKKEFAKEEEMMEGFEVASKVVHDDDPEITYEDEPIPEPASKGLWGRMKNRTKKFFGKAAA